MIDKQIEEMAWELCDIPKHPSIKSCEQCGNKHCHAMYYAERAYNVGYCKASDVAREIIDEFVRKVHIEIHYETSLTGFTYPVVDIDEIDFIAEELKKKYLGEDINAPTKESEGEGCKQ